MNVQETYVTLLVKAQIDGNHEINEKIYIVIFSYTKWLQSYYFVMACIS